MKFLKSYILIFFLLCTASSFAQSSERGFLKRGWDNMIARYNIYFNATQKFEAATDELFEKHVDDFEKFIDVYPYGTATDAKGMRAPMEEVMKKASKVIQNKPHSKWVDDAYFLIGQTHFFANDQYAAIESFQFVYSKYTDPYIKAKSQLWVMKSYVRQEKYDDAEAILSLIRESKSEYKQLKAQTHLVAGDLFVKQGKYQLAVDELVKGVKIIKDKQLRYRTHFLLGQLYLELKQYDKANEEFVAVIKANSPYDYVFQANLGLTKATAESGGKGLKSTKKNLKKMLKDDKNIDYFDQIYYELALLEFVEGNEAAGLDYLFKSSSSASGNANQQTKTYLFLADYFFKNRSYIKSQAYFDSAVSVLPKSYPNYSQITAQHAVLSKLIESIQTVQIQDSMLALAALSPEQLEKKIRSIIQAEQREARMAAEEEELRRQRALMNDNSPITDPTASTGGVWYFYNASQVGRGSNDFIKLWGKRSHGDWWRYANKLVMDNTSQPVDPDLNDDPISYNPDNDQEQQDALAEVAEELLKYYENIPFSSTAKLIAHKKIEASLLQVSKIYFDDLKEYGKAKENLLELLKRYPQSNNKAEALFYLAKSCKAMGDSLAYNEYALQIANEFPSTAYNQVLNNREVVETGEDQAVLDLYNAMYTAFQQDDYNKVKQISKQVSQDHAGNSIQAKFDYLYALTIGKTEGKEAYIAELQAIAENYPGTDIANIASYTVNLLLTENIDPSIDISMYSHKVKEPHFYVLLGSTTDIDRIERELSEYNAKFFPSTEFLIKSIEYKGRQLIYIKTFSDKDKVQAYHMEMKSNYRFLEDAGMNDLSLFAISESNFKTLIRMQNDEAYMAFFDKYFPTQL